MKRFARFGVFLLIFILMLSSVPIAFAAQPLLHTSVSGTALNEHFADTPLPLQGKVNAPLYNASQERAVTFEADEDAVSALIRQGMLARQETISVYYQADYALPTDQQAANDAVFAIARELLEGALNETAQPTEGDSLRYAYHSWSFSGGVTIYQNKTEVTLHYTLVYFTTKAQEDALSAKVDEILASFGFNGSTTELEKIRTIYDYITANVRYDHENLEDESYILKYSAYAALIHKTAVCEGYALLFYRLAEEAGLDARVITGLGGSPAENHAWNIVRVGENYYYLDATWDEGQREYRYFLKGRNDFPGHTNDAKFDAAEFTAAYPIPETGYVFEEDGAVYTEGNYKYTLSGGNATIIEYIGAEAHIVVPAALGAHSVKYVDSKVFYGNQTVETITFSEGILSHGWDALDYCQNLTAVHYSSTMQVTASVSAGFSNAPTNCPSLATITVAAGNPHIKAVDGILYDHDMQTLLLCPPDNGMTAYTVPDGVTLIAPEAFAHHNTLTAVSLPDSVITIGSFAFSAAYLLEEAAIPENCKYIGQYIYAETKVSSVHIPATAETIRLCAFDHCKLASITVDEDNPYFTVTDGVLHDGYRAMRSEVDTVGVVTLPEGIVELENGTFRYCSDIADIRLPSTLELIGQSAFSECNSLTHLTVPEGVTHIGQGAFGSCGNLVSIIIPDSLEEFEGYLFHPYDHTTVYGGTPAQNVAWSGGLNYKSLAEFVCHSGHDLQETVSEDTDYSRIYHYTCAVCGGRTMERTHQYPQISEAVLTLSFTEATYTGSPLVPTIQSVVYRGKTLTEGVDYTANYPSNSVDADSHHVSITGIGEYRGFNSKRYTILQADIATAKIEMPQTNFEYDGTPIVPEFTVRWNGKELVRYEDYGFRFENNNAEGIATLVVTGNRNFKGELRQNFAIGEHEHRYVPTEIDASTHRGECVCGRTTAAAPHSWDTACDYYCNDCYYYREVEHPWSENWSNGVFNHYRLCTVCGEVTDLGQHSGGSATCSSAAVCDICHLAYGDPLPHDWDMETLKNDPQYHYHPCKNCTAGEYHELHHGGQASCTDEGRCVDCAYPYQTTLPHTFGTKWTLITSSTHSRACTKCGTPEQAYSHTYNNKGVCSACGHDSGNRPAPKPKPKNPFTDVKSSDYFSAPVLWAVENNVTAGTSPTTFSPNDFCTRAQVVTFLWRAAGSPKARNERNPFVDVKKGQYYYNAVLWAVEKGITAGVSATSFAPEDTCTRGQIVAFLYRFAGQPKATGSNPFVDVKSNQYFYKAVLWAVKNNITTGVDATHFAPNDTCTRAQVVTFLYRHIS